MTTNTIGARWWRFDFHTHTPASMDYGKGPNHKTLANLTPKEWLLGFMHAEVDCVAITDHNTGEWIDQLKDEYRVLELNQEHGFRELVLFPGVEISVSGGIHMLAIFDPTKTRSDIDSLLGAVGFPAKNHGTSDACTEESPQKVARKIHEVGGLAIPAHADDFSGIFKVLPGTTLKGLLEDRCLSAIEIVDMAYREPVIYRESGLNLPYVVGTDSHHPSGTSAQNLPGSRFTWVKMGQPSLDGLRLALLDGAPLSIIRSDAGSADPNQEPRLTIQSIEIDNARYMGRGTPEVASFSPWLSAIIGGRGTGKSTLIEMMRLGLRRKNEVPAGLLNEFEEFVSVPTSRNGLGTLTHSTETRITLRKDGLPFRVRWRQDGIGTAIEEQADDGSWKPSPGEVATRFPVRILSQKQVFALANDPHALLGLVDEAEPVNRRERDARRDKAEADFLSLRSQARSLGVRLADRPRLEGEIADLERQIALFEEGGHKDLLHRYQRSGRQRQVLRARARELETQALAVQRVVEEIEPSDFPAEEFERDAEARRLLTEAVDRQREFADALRLQSASIKDFRTQWIEKVSNSQWSRDRQETRSSYKDLVAKLASAGVSDPDAYGSLLQRQIVLRSQLAELDTLNAQIRELDRQAMLLLEEMETQRRELTSARAAFLEEVLKGNSYVQIEVVPFGLTANAAEGQFRQALAREDRRLESAILSAGGDQGVLADLFLDLPDDQSERAEEIASRVRDLKDLLVAIHDGERGVPGMQHMANHLRRQTPEQMDRLRMWWPEDGLRLRYRRVTTGEFRPLEQGSPGQKSAAILAFLLSYGEEPIILDQPEDDLDNHLIYDLVVRQIRENKRRRQVIVATHNPNIVVNGDAEAVISMDHQGGQCIVAEDGTGCLQDRGVRAEVCRVMEGGRRAFEDRYRRLKGGIDDA